MIKLRLKKYGRKGQPCYRIVAMDSRKKRDGASIEELGFYNPMSDETHLKCSVTQNGSQTIGAIGFGLGSKCDLIQHKKPFKAAYSLDINEWNGTKSIQLKLRDIQE